MSSLLNLIKSAKSRVFTRCYIKRRNATTGLFESTWFEITDDVKKFGKITNAIDAQRRSKFTFGNAKIVVENSNGRYNPHNDAASLWFGYLNQQRTLVRIDTGFLYSTKDTNSGIYTNYEFPYAAQWDVAGWDDPQSTWDAEESSTVFIGVISGDIVFSETNDVTFNIKPLVSVFQDYAAKNLTGWTSTGMTASQFIGMVRDQTDGAGSFIFRPFFSDTTTYWDISTTSNIYANLNTATANGVIDKNVFEIIEKLSEAEDYVPYVSKEGIFKFVSRGSGLTATSFEFYGAGSRNSQYGQTIKKVSSYGFRSSKYYSSVQIKFRDENTATSYLTVETTMTVSATNNPWVLGSKTLKIENSYIQTTATALALATNIFNDSSALKNEIEFDTTFVPHLDLFDRISVTYDPNPFNVDSLWDQRNWAADNTSTSDDLTWDAQENDSLLLSGQEFKFISIELDLDNYSTKILAREV